MIKYSLLLSYAGTNYCGWQRQKDEPTEGLGLKGESKLKRSGDSAQKHSIQATLEAALLKMTGESVRVVGSGRTDSGVHAAGQVAHFILKEPSSRWNEEIICRGLNGLLPMSIRILRVESVPLPFHAQKSALKKQYSYYFQQGPCPLPHLEPYSWWIRKKLDLHALRTALKFLEGEHDFKPFQASGAKPGPTVRKILETEVRFDPIGFPEVPVFEDEVREGVSGVSPLGLVRVRIVGTGFLKQMVRGIAGTLLQIGEGRRPAEDMRRIIETQDRQEVGPTAPARALWLEQVWYPHVPEIPKRIEMEGLFDLAGERAEE